MSTRGTVMVSVRIALPGIFVAVFATVSRTHAMAVRGEEYARDKIITKIGIIFCCGGGGALTIV